MIVCYGEVHQFSVQPGRHYAPFCLISSEENMLSIASRTCRRWNLSRDDFEIQDINFKTYPDDMTWKDYIVSGGSTVVRLVRKAASAGLTGGELQTS